MNALKFLTITAVGLSAAAALADETPVLTCKAITGQVAVLQGQDCTVLPGQPGFVDRSATVAGSRGTLLLNYCVGSAQGKLNYQSLMVRVVDKINPLDASESSLAATQVNNAKLRRGEDLSAYIFVNPGYTVDGKAITELVTCQRTK